MASSLSLRRRAPAAVADSAEARGDGVSPVIEACCARWVEETGRRAEAVLVEIEGLLPPRDYLAALDRFAEVRPAEAEALRARHARRLLLRRPIRRFALIDHGPAVSLYTSGGPRANKTLVTVFTGAASRPGTWMPVFLNAFDDRQHDVLVLRDRSGRHFRTGCTGFADSLPELVDRVADVFGAPGYARQVAFGVSRGAAAALGYGRLAGCERAVAVGALPRSDPARLLMGIAMPAAFDPLCDCLSERPVRGIYVHAEGNVADAAFAGDLLAQFGGLRLSVPGTTEHGIVQVCAVTESLRRLLRRVLDARPPPAPPEPAAFRHFHLTPRILHRTRLGRAALGLRAG